MTHLSDPIAKHYRLKRPCGNCPFLKSGAIELASGRLEGIIEGLVRDDRSTFQCHKTVHSKRGGEFDDDGNYYASGEEAMCHGAASYLMKMGRPTIGMRLAVLTGTVSASSILGLASFKDTRRFVVPFSICRMMSLSFLRRETHANHSKQSCTRCGL